MKNTVIEDVCIVVEPGLEHLLESFEEYSRCSEYAQNPIDFKEWCKVVCMTTIDLITQRAGRFGKMDFGIFIEIDEKCSYCGKDWSTDDQGAPVCCSLAHDEHTKERSEE